MKALISFLFLFISIGLYSQNDFKISDPIVEDILGGDFEPADYMPDSTTLNSTSLSIQLQELLDPEQLARLTATMKAQDLTYHNAAESSEWVYAQFSAFSAQNENRLRPFYLEYTDNLGLAKTHRIACALLPGKYTNTHDLVVVEVLGKDNTLDEAAMIMELARIISAVDFDQNLLFIVNLDTEVAETAKQAFNMYTSQKDIRINARFDYEIIKDWDDKFPGVFMAYRGCR